MPFSSIQHDLDWLVEGSGWEPFGISRAIPVARGRTRGAGAPLPTWFPQNRGAAAQRSHWAVAGSLGSGFQVGHRLLLRFTKVLKQHMMGTYMGYCGSPKLYGNIERVNIYLE